MQSQVQCLANEPLFAELVGPLHAKAALGTLVQPPHYGFPPPPPLHQHDDLLTPPPLQFGSFSLRVSPLTCPAYFMGRCLN